MPAPETQSLEALREENLQLRRAVEELSILNAIGSAIGSTMDLNEVVELIVQESVKNLNVEQAAVMLLKLDEEEADPFRTMARQAYSGSEIVPFRFGQQLTGWMLKHRIPLLINDLQSDERFRAVANAEFPIRSLLSVPLRAQGKMVGLLNVFNKRAEAGFTAEDQRLLSIIASQSSQVVQNARLYDQLQQRSKELQDSETKYRALMEESSEAILLAGVGQRRILEVNDQAVRLTGLPRERLIGRKIGGVLPVPELDNDETYGRIARGESVRVSFRFDEGNAPRYVDLSATLVSYGENRVIQVICLDVTERERLADHLRHHAEELEAEVGARTKDLRESQARLIQQEKMAALGMLVAGIAHEMNTPIGTINSNADTLGRSIEIIKAAIDKESTPDSVRSDTRLNRALQLLDDIAGINKIACERIVAIVGSLRNFARLDEAELQIVDLQEGIESTLTLVRHELKNRIQVVKEYGEIPRVRCHPNQINQVFMNLLVNASQAIKGEGEIAIKTFRKGDIVGVRISDSGVGIPPETLSKIFDPGFTTKGVGVGTGLGLSICFKIAEDHDGSIEVESELGKGTTFTLLLPVPPDLGKGAAE